MLNEENCGQHSASEISQSDIITECNKNDPTKAKHDRIVNGKIAEAGTLPWQVSSSCTTFPVVHLLSF